MFKTDLSENLNNGSLLCEPVMMTLPHQLPSPYYSKDCFRSATYLTGFISIPLYT